MIYDDPKVNDMSLVGMTHDEAVDVIKTSTSPLTLTLQTPIKQGTHYTLELHCSYTCHLLSWDSIRIQNL